MIDVNGTRFHLLLGRDDWARCGVASGAVRWSDERSELTLEPISFRFPPPVEAPNPVEARRGAARDRFGNWYWIDPDAARVRVLSSGSGQITDFWPLSPAAIEPPPGEFRAAEDDPPAPAPEQLTGLAVTEDHYLIAGTLAPAGLLVFDLHAGGPPRHLVWPPSVPFAPFDLAASRDGRLWILDRAHRRYWVIDRHLGIVVQDQALVDLTSRPDDFEPVDAPPGGPGRPPARFPTGISLEASSPVDAVDPVAIEALPDGTVLILDRTDPVRVLRYRFGQRVGAAVVLDVAGLLSRPPEPGEVLLGADLAYAPATPATGERLYVPAADGNQVFAFHIDRTDQALSAHFVADEYFPMRLFGGKALVVADGRPWYDVDDKGWVPLALQRRPRYRREAVLEAPVFDGHEAGCVWHRLLLDACIPPQAAVDVWSRVADEEAALSRVAWAREPSLRRRPDGAELPYLGGAGTFELLFQRARGRFLQLRLALRGDGRTSPRLRALRAWYPRFSYLEKYMPAVYREDPESASFLDRFLANVEGQFTALEDRMAAAQVLLDPRVAPAEALQWLAGWLGIALDPAWDEARRRLFIRHAMDFFRLRGTLRGLELALRVAFDDCADERMFGEDDAARPASIRILERYQVRRVPGVVFGDPLERGAIRSVPIEPALRWVPAHGGERLLEAWRAARAAAGLPDDGSAFPARPPAGALGAPWRAFAADVLGFVPADGSAAELAWQDFLRRRYRRIAAAARAYGRAWASFDEVRLPDVLPPDGAPLADWYSFQSLAMGLRRTAHRFTVLLPVRSSEAFAVEELRARRERARRIIEVEKPAHTLFDVKLYWAMFRIGEARLGVDTLLDVGSRAPELLPPIVLGQGFLAESYLAARPPESVPERRILGRDPLAQRCHIEETTP